MPAAALGIAADLADAGGAGVACTTRARGRRCSARSTTWPRPRTAATASTRSRCTPARAAPPSGPTPILPARGPQGAARARMAHARRAVEGRAVGPRLVRRRSGADAIWRCSIRRARDLARAYRWGFVEPPFVGGARPGGRGLVRHAAAELDAGPRLVGHRRSRRRDRRAIKPGPPLTPAVAWLKRQPQETTLVLGGRHLGAGDRARHLTFGGTAIETFSLPGGFFLPTVHAAGRRSRSGAARLSCRSSGDVGRRACRSSSSTRSHRACRCSAYDTGWQEPEFNLAENRPGGG